MQCYSLTHLLACYRLTVEKDGKRVWERLATLLYTKPNLAVAFPTGHAECAVEDWAPTLKHFTNTRYYTLFTTYDKNEMVQETAALARLGARFLVRGEKNRWSGKTPMQIEHGVFSYNQFWYIVAGHGMETE